MRRRGLVLVVGLILVLPSCAKRGRAPRPHVEERGGRVKVLFAPELAGEADFLLDSFRRCHPGMKLEKLVGRPREWAGALKRDLPDVVVAFGVLSLLPLSKADLVVEGSMVEIGRAPLALAVPKENPGRVSSLEDLARPGLKVGVADPEQYPSLGRPTLSLLVKAGLWGKIKRRARKVASLEELLSALKRREVEAAIVPLPSVRELGHIRVVQELPKAVEVAAVALKGENLGQARCLLSFLKSKGVRAALVDKGFLPPKPKGKGVTLLVHSGAGLRPPMDEIGRLFEKRYGVKVRYNYAGSACLLGMIMMSHKGDLYLPGEKFYLDQARERGYIERYKVVAYFIPVIAVQKGNPKGIRTLEDLARPGLRVGLGEPKACAIGHVSEQILRKNGLLRAVKRNVVMRALIVQELCNALALKAIDASIVWDATAAMYSKFVDAIPIPPERNVITSCPLGILKFTEHPEWAGKFLEFVATEGKRIFEKHHYTVDLKRPVYPYRGG